MSQQVEESYRSYHKTAFEAAAIHPSDAAEEASKVRSVVCALLGLSPATFSDEDSEDPRSEAAAGGQSVATEDAEEDRGGDHVLPRPRPSATDPGTGNGPGVGHEQVLESSAPVVEAKSVGEKEAKVLDETEGTASPGINTATVHRTSHGSSSDTCASISEEIASTADAPGPPALEESMEKGVAEESEDVVQGNGDQVQHAVVRSFQKITDTRHFPPVATISRWLASRVPQSFLRSYRYTRSALSSRFHSPDTSYLYRCHH